MWERFVGGGDFDGGMGVHGTGEINGVKDKFPFILSVFHYCSNPLPFF
jgi:hypothetical protein